MLLFRGGIFDRHAMSAFAKTPLFNDKASGAMPVTQNVAHEARGHKLCCLDAP
jgi:hypothetical protein